MRLAFISGPYRAATPSGIVQNIRNAERAAVEYWRKGYAVICPHKNSALFDGLAPDCVWLDGDLELLRRSDVVVMIPGWQKSSGAINEESLAINLGKEIHYLNDNLESITPDRDGTRKENTHGTPTN